MQILTIKSNDRILIVAPHPDDECIGAGGILALYPQMCTVLVLTDGGQGQGDVPPEKERKIRKCEFYAEMRELGIKRYQMLDYEDGTLMRHTDCMLNIPISYYTKIFVTGISDNHPDHTAACLSVYNALRYQNIHNIEIYLYEVHSLMQQPSHILDISNVIDEKMKLIRFHKSQLASLPYDLLSKSMAEYRGIQNRQTGKYLEAYLYRRYDEQPDDKTIELEDRLQKQILFYWILTSWMDYKIKGHNIAELLENLGYYKIAVYGYAELGRLLCSELQATDVDVVYVMDKKILKTEWENIPMHTPQKGLPKVDCVVVTAIYYFDEIKNELLEMGFGSIISLKNLLEDFMKDSVHGETKNV